MRDLEDTLIEQNSYSHYIYPVIWSFMLQNVGFLNAFNERTSFFLTMTRVKMFKSVPDFGKDDYMVISKYCANWPLI